MQMEKHLVYEVHELLHAVLVVVPSRHQLQRHLTAARYGPCPRSTPVNAPVIRQRGICPSRHEPIEIAVQRRASGHGWKHVAEDERASLWGVAQVQRTGTEPQKPKSVGRSDFSLLAETAEDSTICIGL